MSIWPIYSFARCFIYKPNIGRNAVKKVRWIVLLAICFSWGTALSGEKISNTTNSVQGAAKEGDGGSPVNTTEQVSALMHNEKRQFDDGSQIEAEFLDEDLDFLDEEEGDGQVVSIADPLAPWNRLMFRFNDRLYYWFLKPVSTGYKAAVPHVVRKGVENFFENLGAPVRMGSCLVQGKGKEAQAEFVRFTYNTTFGMLGFGDLSERYPELATHDEDMGQALAVHGVNEGYYVVWPVLGPSTFRDTAGTVGDLFMNPISYLPIGASLSATGEKKVNSASFRLGDYEALTDAAIDPYDAVRDAYLQYRRAKVEE
jgi:phospholipid-binding lipoprotein MlaA